MSEIAACPWCGGECKSAWEHPFYVRCLNQKCQAEGPLAETESAAIAAHNSLSERLEKVAELEAAIRRHRDQRGDDRCWMDDSWLYAILPEGYSPPAIDSAVELENCKRFIECRRNPATTYVSPQRRIDELEAVLRDCSVDKRLAAADKLAVVAYKSGVLVSTGELEAALAAYRAASKGVTNGA